jgi:hypothetical protein
VRDTITWMIPILWPIDLINLPRRGPRPTLKAETSITLRVMQDFEVPDIAQPQRDPYGLIPRGQGADADVPPPPQEQAPAPEMSYAPDPQPMAPDYQQAPPAMEYAPPVMAYAPPPPPAMPYYVAPQPMFYGSVVIGPRAPMVAYGYGARGYYARPGVTAYGAYGAYGARPGVGVAPRAAYGYGYGARPTGGASMQARVGGGAALGRGAMAARGSYRGR